MSEHLICDNIIVNENLNHLYRIILDIPYEPNDLKSYFEKIFQRMTHRSNEKYLQNAECLSMYNFYNFICSQSDMTKSQSDDVNSLTKINNNFVVTLRVPPVPGRYHYITAVVSPRKKYVDIYQSYGGTRKLYALSNLPLRHFLTLLQDCKDLITSPTHSYYYDMLKIKRIGRVLSRIMNLECKALENETADHTHDYTDDDSDDPDYVDKLMSLKYSDQGKITMVNKALGFFNKRAIDIIKNDYLTFINDPSKTFVMNIYTPPTLGGKLNKHKKSNSKKSKRKTRRKNI
jgi:hypothetical protein